MSLASVAFRPGGAVVVEGEGLLVDAFRRDVGAGILSLLRHGLKAVDEAARPPAAFLESIGRAFVGKVCHLPEGAAEGIAGATAGRAAGGAAGAAVAIELPERGVLDAWVNSAPPMAGAEYLSREVLAKWWFALDAVARHERASTQTTLAQWVSSISPAWHTVGRVTFHLAENKRADTAGAAAGSEGRGSAAAARPFAFMATYSGSVGEGGQAQHIALGRALDKYGGENDKAVMLSLLRPVHEAAKRLPWVDELVKNKTIYRALMWTPAEAYRLLRDLPLLEEAGLRVRVPDWWRSPPTAKVSVKIGETVKTKLGVDALLDFTVTTTLDGERLTEAEIEQLIGAGEGLVRLRGKWARVDGEKLKEALAHWKEVESQVGSDGLSFLEGMRLLAGVDRVEEQEPESIREDAVWSGVEPGEWLGKTLAELRSPSPEPAQIAGLKATLRPYQAAGVRWLRELASLRLGACLADDMGLGKTLQVIALLLERKAAVATGRSAGTGEPVGQRQVSLLVVPASLVGNWQHELARFAPSLRSIVLHGSMGEDVRDHSSLEAAILGADLAITTYGMVARSPAVRERPGGWDLVILDEAQAIKNPGARQTRAVKELKGRTRIALTGTPVENRLSDLWSLFDFLNPGLLGSAKAFGSFVKKLKDGAEVNYGPLRTLTAPYILRRLKTDKRIIADLPEKTEIRAFCGLTRQQAALYETAVRELAEIIKNVEGAARRGVVLAYLTRFKQLCNHPSQWTGDGLWDESASGKFTRLKEICEELAERQEKVLVFTQFQEMTAPLSRALVDVFGRSGLVLHGGTPVKQRQQLVRDFQADGGPPFFVLSLKAGGTGLNLTAANHVIHFDRWWNPAVENQATDRAFRIGQKKNVMVHKFVVTGTIEERIDELISEKQLLAEETLGESDGVATKLLSEMSDSELLNFVSLDVSKAVVKE